MRALFAVVSILAVSSVSCSHGTKDPLAGGPRVDVGEAQAALVLPPEKDTPGTLRQLETLARGGDPAAQWVTLHYLMDLLDAARFAQDPQLADPSRTLLFAALDLTPAEGPAATDAVLDALLLRADQLLEKDRLHAGALAARTLLAFDRTRPTRSELFGTMGAIKAVARGGGPLAGSAILRLADFCRVAFKDAVNAPTQDRPQILAACLYPLFDANPAPYFARDPAARPPEPAWQDLADGIVILYKALAEQRKSRLAELVPGLIAELDTFLAKHKMLLPVRRDPGDLGLAAAPVAAPYEWTPLVLLGDGSRPPAGDLVDKLRDALSKDPRARIAVALTAGAPAGALLAAVQVARLAGADVVELAVATLQTIKPPRGDYWYGRAPHDQIARVGVLPMVIDQGGPAAHAAGWDPARATLGLHLVVGETRWRLVSARGTLGEIAAGPGANPEPELAALLGKVRLAFPDEDALVLVPEGSARVLTLVRALVAARGTADQPLARVFALADSPPRPSGKADLAVRVARRAGVQVELAPAALAPRVPGARQCVLDAVDRNPGLKGTLTLTLAQPVAGVAPAISVSGTTDSVLRACLSLVLTPDLRDAKIDRAQLVIVRK